MDDREMMALALVEAEAAYARGECPVGAVLTRDGELLARDGNREIELCDPTAHAEVLVVRHACRLLGRHTLPDCIVFTTLWPCPMCANTLLRAKVPTVLCGAESFSFIYEHTFDPAHLTVRGPMMSEECRGLFIRWARETGREFILGADRP